MILKNSFWDSHTELHAYCGVLFIILIFLLGFMIALSSILHPWLLLVNETLKNIPFDKISFIQLLVPWASKGVMHYFPHRIIYDQEKSKYDFLNKKYIKCLSPHGVIPFTVPFLFYKDEEKDAFGMDFNKLITSHQMYEFSFVSHFTKVLGGIPADYDQMKKVLDSGKSILFYPGGIRETFLTSHEKENIVIKKRKGFFKLALETGSDILPIYTFGISEMYQRSSISIKIPKFFKNENDSVAWYWGLFGTPFPKRVPLMTVVGKPIHVPFTKNPSDEDIKKLRIIYTKQIKFLFYKYRSIYKKEWSDKIIHFL